MIRLHDLKAKQFAAKLKLAKEKYGIDFDVIVKSRNKKFRVCRIDVTLSDKPWVKGYPQKKDGTFSNTIRNLYASWEVVE